MSFIFFLSGFISIIAQTFLIRELLVVLSGNELNLGLMFSCWFLGVALGNLVSIKYLIKNDFDPRKTLAASFMALAVFLCFGFIFIRDLRDIFNVLPGGAFGPGQSIFIFLLSLGPVSFMAGIQFSMGAKMLEKSGGLRSSAEVYLYEAAGALAGGAVFTFFLINFLNSAWLLFTLMLFCLSAAIKVSEDKKIKKLLAVIGVVFASAMPFTANSLEKKTLDSLYSGFKVEGAANSHYGQIAVISKETEKFVCVNGAAVKSIPDTDTQRQEEFCVVSSLLSRSPSRILIIGGAGRYAKTFHDITGARPDMIEWDPVLVKVLEKYSALPDPSRGVVHTIDPVEYLGRTAKKYDLAVIAVPYPVTLSMNRFFTKEFLLKVKQALKQGGAAAFFMPGSDVYVEENLAGMLGSLYKTLGAVYSQVKALPGGGTIFLASDSGFPGDDEVMKSFEGIKDRTVFVSKGYIAERLDPGRQETLKVVLEKTGQDINSDLRPVLLTTGLRYWRSVFQSGAGRVFDAAEKYAWLLWAVLVLLFLRGKTGPEATSFITGAYVMGAQMILIYLLQIFKGEIYHWIGLLTAVFMAGTALGALFDKLSGHMDVAAKNRYVEAAMFIWGLLLLFFVMPGFMRWQNVFIMSLGMGMFLGFQFPVLAKKAAEGSVPESSSGSGIYLFDMAGACVSALLTGSLLLPLWGVRNTLVFLLILKLISLKYWLFKR